MLNGVAGGEGATSPTPGSNGVSMDAFSEMKKERDQLRDELRELENSYSDLFKRYEKMRENCVLLKNVSSNELTSMQYQATSTVGDYYRVKRISRRMRRMTRLNTTCSPTCFKSCGKRPLRS